MPSKERYQLEKMKKLEEQELSKRLGEWPSHLSPKPMKNPFSAITDIPWGLVSVDESSGELVQHRKIGVGGNLGRQADRDDRKEVLKAEFPDIWGDNSKAHIIALKSAKILSLEKNLDVKTIKNYFKD